MVVGLCFYTVVGPPVPVPPREASPTVGRTPRLAEVGGEVRRVGPGRVSGLAEVGVEVKLLEGPRWQVPPREESPRAVVERVSGLAEVGGEVQLLKALIGRCLLVRKTRPWR